MGIFKTKTAFSFKGTAATHEYFLMQPYTFLFAPKAIGFGLPLHTFKTRRRVKMAMNGNQNEASGSNTPRTQAPEAYRRRVIYLNGENRGSCSIAETTAQTTAETTARTRANFVSIQMDPIPPTMLNLPSILYLF